MDPLPAAALTVLASAIIAPRLIGRRAPWFAPSDLAWFVVGVGVMAAAAYAQVAPASAWSPLVDLGSFAVGTSLVVTQMPGTWPRRVGWLILGIHGAQVVLTNDNAVLGAFS